MLKSNKSKNPNILPNGRYKPKNEALITLRVGMLAYWKSKGVKTTDFFLFCRYVACYKKKQSFTYGEFKDLWIEYKKDQGKNDSSARHNISNTKKKFFEYFTRYNLGKVRWVNNETVFYPYGISKLVKISNLPEVGYNFRINHSNLIENAFGAELEFKTNAIRVRGEYEYILERLDNKQDKQDFIDYVKFEREKRKAFSMNSSQAKYLFEGKKVKLRSSLRKFIKTLRSDYSNLQSDQGLQLSLEALSDLTRFSTATCNKHLRKLSESQKINLTVGMIKVAPMLVQRLDEGHEDYDNIQDIKDEYIWEGKTAKDIWIEEKTLYVKGTDGQKYPYIVRDIMARYEVVNRKRNNTNKVSSFFKYRDCNRIKLNTCFIKQN